MNLINLRLSDFFSKWWPVILMGIATVGAYGLVLYSFGVFIGPIREETGWSNGAISAAFSLGVLISGIGAMLAGRFLDAVGSRPVMAISLTMGSGLLYFTASTDSLSVFVVTWGLGGGIIGAGLFYNITMAITTRLYQTDRAKAFAILTLIGGLASPIYFPLAGVLVEWLGWRSAMRALIAVMIIMVVPSIVMIGGGSAQNSVTEKDQQKKGFLDILAAFKSRHITMLILAFSFSMCVMVAIQVHHVPAMKATGLTLSLATALAGIRGFLSLPGRALLSPIVKLLGIKGAIQVVYAAMAIGCLSLFFAGSIGFVIGFTVITGLTFGLIAPLHGLYAAEVFGETHIGTMMGVQTTIVSIVAASGPTLLGMSVDFSGGYSWFLIISMMITILAMFSLSLSK